MIYWKSYEGLTWKFPDLDPGVVIVNASYECPYCIDAKLTAVEPRGFGHDGVLHRWPWRWASIEENGNTMVLVTHDQRGNKVARVVGALVPIARPTEDPDPVALTVALEEAIEFARASAPASKLSEWEEILDGRRKSGST